MSAPETQISPASAAAQAAAGTYKVVNRNDPDPSDCERNNADSHLRGMPMGRSLSLQARSRPVAVRISGI